MKSGWWTDGKSWMLLLVSLHQFYVSKSGKCKFINILSVVNGKVLAQRGDNDDVDNIEIN